MLETMELPRSGFVQLMDRAAGGSVRAKPSRIAAGSHFTGEVLVVAARDDVVFSPRVSRELAREYPRSRFVLVDGVHRLSDDADRQARLRRAFFLTGLGTPELRALPDE